MPLENHPKDPEKYIYKTQEYNLSQLSVPSTITFHNPLSQGWLMRITAKGRIEVAEGADVTETARQVLDAMEGMLGDRIKKAKLDEREAFNQERQQYADWLDEAATDIEDWGMYASEYLQDKYDLQGQVQDYKNRALSVRARGQA
jgi:hypothetical protein